MRPGAVGRKVGFVGVVVRDPRLFKRVDDLASYRLPCVLSVVLPIRVPHEAEDFVNGAGRGS